MNRGFDGPDSGSARPSGNPVDSLSGSTIAVDGATSVPCSNAPAGCISARSCTASAAVQLDPQGSSVSPAGTAGSVPQSWAFEVCWSGSAPRHRQIPDPARSAAKSTAGAALVRTGLRLERFRRNVKGHGKTAIAKFLDNGCPFHHGTPCTDSWALDQVSLSQAPVR